MLNSINAVGVDIDQFSAMKNEEEVLLLPGLPLVNRPGENPERDLWTFDVETPDASVATVDSPSVMIDYVHPGMYEYRLYVRPGMYVCMYVSTRYSPLSDSQ